MLRSNPDVQAAIQDPNFMNKLKEGLPEINWNQDLSDEDFVKAYKYVMAHP